MRNLFYYSGLAVLFLSCGKNIIGTYNTSYSNDKSALYEIKLNADKSVEKTEIHTIKDYAKGKYIVDNDRSDLFFRFFNELFSKRHNCF